MSNDPRPDRRYRALLSETLPYEVPAIFSNDKLFYSVTGQINTPTNVDTHLEHVRRDLRFTRPYNYRIAKNQRKYTTLSIIHPANQINVADFYEGNARAILAACSRSQFSLRKPVEVASTWSVGQIALNDPSKDGLAHVEVEEDETDVSHYVTYFQYRKYNLINKFFDSYEMTRLEKRFSHMRTLDISRCFQNIYTHSESWAIKSKDFAKRHTQHYTFEGRFDKLMQCMNYNETNGIVIGPEISRIFAEIILQDADAKIFATLRDKHQAMDSRTYAIRRYVDDYFIFANSAEVIELITRVISEQLEFYKLFLNDDKRADYRSPFVTNITLARDEISSALTVFDELLRHLKDGATPESINSYCRQARNGLKAIRMIVTRHQVEFSTVSGWFLARIKRVMRAFVEQDGLAKLGPTPSDEVLKLLVTLLEVSFYVCALDTRVRATYNICQISSLAVKLYPNDQDYIDVVKHAIAEELLLILRRKVADGLITGEVIDDVEAQNLLICGAQTVGIEFLRSDAPIRILQHVAKAKMPTYFSYIVAKFCFLKNDVLFKSQLDMLNANVKAKLLSEKSMSIFDDAESYLLFCDFVSAPDVAVIDKMEVWAQCAGTTPTNAELTALGEHLGFVDWAGLGVDHRLKRKELRPVYASA